MKFDLVEINKLSPPGLWDLATLSAVISMLLGVVKSGLGGTGASAVYIRMIIWHRSKLRKKTAENLNMRVKAWVMQCPERIAWARGIIGEAAIRKWQKNRLADYALSKYFGDWKRKWPNGFDRKTAPIKRQSRFKVKDRVYNWKLFALTKIINVERFLYGRLADTAKITELQAACKKLWNVEVQDDEKLSSWSQPRQKRTIKPVRFSPYELQAEAAAGIEREDVNPVNYIENTSIKRLNAPPEEALANIKSKQSKLDKDAQKPP